MTRILFMLAIASALSGCASRGVSLPKGLSLPNCSYGVMLQSEPARCMTRSEYTTARKKVRNAEGEDAQESGKKTDPRYKDWIP